MYSEFIKEELTLIQSLYKEELKSKDKVRLPSFLKLFTDIELQNKLRALCLAFPKLSTKLLYQFALHYLSNGDYPKCETCNRIIIQPGNSDKLARACSKECVSSKLIGTGVKKTFLEKYGSERPFQEIPELKMKVEAKARKTRLDKYGVEQIFHSPEFREKKRLTQVKNFGTENFQGNKAVLDRRHKTMLQKYGKKSVGHDCLSLAYTYQIKRLSSEGFTLEESLKNYLGVKKKKDYKVTCNKCTSTFECSLDNGVVPFCTQCYPKSKLEHKVTSLLNDLQLVYKANKRGVLDQPLLELDLYVPDKSIAIETNGVYYHSVNDRSLVGYAKQRHLLKHRLCQDKQIRLLQFFEDEILEKWDIVKDIICRSFGRTTKIGARELTIKEVPSEEERIFCNENHIQGFVPSKCCYGLYNKEGDLFALMSFGNSRFSSKVEWELLRFCSRKGFTVQGGSRKLFEAFRKNLKPKSIISYCDLRLFKGNLYEDIGFTYSHSSKPNYFYTRGVKRHSRIGFQKHKLADKLLIYDPELTEMQNMFNNGYRVLWDCGNKVFIWNEC